MHWTVPRSLEKRSLPLRWNENTNSDKYLNCLMFRNSFRAGSAKFLPLRVELWLFSLRCNYCDLFHPLPNAICECVVRGGAATIAGARLRSPSSRRAFHYSRNSSLGASPALYCSESDESRIVCGMRSRRPPSSLRAPRCVLGARPVAGLTRRLPAHLWRDWIPLFCAQFIAIPEKRPASASLTIHHLQCLSAVDIAKETGKWEEN